MATADLGSILNTAVQGGYIAQLSGGTYTVTQPIIININSTTQGVGLNGGGATIISQVPAGQPVIEFVIVPGVDLRYLDLSNFIIQGNGSEGDGIKIVADGNDRWVYNWNVDNVTVAGVGGYGLDVQGSVFEGLVSNSWMTNNAQGGAIFQDSANGGIVSALRWFGGGLQNNGGNGLTLANGARDMSVDGATISGNQGDGINALNGITSVSNSTLQDNHGSGIDFWLYGNFNNDTFANTTGAQTTSINGFLAGDAVLIGDTSQGSPLANLQGNGHALLIGNSGSVVAGSGVAQASSGGDNYASVIVSNQGISVPALSPITAATTAPVANSNGTGALEAALHAALTGGTVTHLTAPGYTVSSPIVINITQSTQGPIGIDLGGARIFSQVTGGAPLIEIIVDSGDNVGTLTLSNFSIQGDGSEADGIKIVADGSDRSIGNLLLTNVNVQNVGGIGLDVVGNIAHGTIWDSWMNGNGHGGARFADSANGGVASGLQWIGGGFRLNGTAGLILDNGAHDMTVRGAYFVENNGPGINATTGINLVQASGFENNAGVGAVVGGSGGNITDDTFSTYGIQTAALAGNLLGGKITVTGSDEEYYGGSADPTISANVQGAGTLDVAGGGKFVVGSGITVAGANPVVGGPITMTEAVVSTSPTAAFPFSNDFLAEVEALYVGYYTRAGDPAGVSYWVGSLNNGSNTLQTEAAWFSRATESQTQYPFLANSSAATQSQIASFIASIYQDLFNHAPDSGGLSFWTNVLSQNLGNAQAVGNSILDVIHGAQGSDQTIVANKVMVAEGLTNAFAAAGSFDNTLAHTLIASVTADPATMVAAEQHQIPAPAVEVVGQPIVDLTSIATHV